MVDARTASLSGGFAAGAVIRFRLTNGSSLQVAVTDLLAWARAKHAGTAVNWGLRVDVRLGCTAAPHTFLLDYALM